MKKTKVVIVPNVDAKWHVAVSEVAVCYGITERRVQLLVKRPEFANVKLGHGLYNFFEFARVYADYQSNLGRATAKKVVDNDDHAIGIELDARLERARLHKAQADRVEMDNAVRRGELALIEDFKNVAAGIQVSNSSLWDALPGRLSGLIAGEVSRKYELRVDPGFVYEIIRAEAVSARNATSDRLMGFLNGDGQ